MFEQTFKNIDNILWKDPGCSTELHYVEQTSWILFLKYLDDLEKDRQDIAELTGKTYKPIIDPRFRWDVWVAPKNGDGRLDHHRAMTGDDLTRIVAALNTEQKQFLEFVLSKYIETGVEKLDQEKLPELLKLKYLALDDAKKLLGTIDAIRNMFIGFQQHLYEQDAAV